MLGQENNFYLISLSIPITGTCVMDIVRYIKGWNKMLITTRS